MNHTRNAFFHFLIIQLVWLNVTGRETPCPLPRLRHGSFQSTAEFDESKNTQSEQLSNPIEAAHRKDGLQAGLYVDNCRLSSEENDHSKASSSTNRRVPTSNLRCPAPPAATATSTDESCLNETATESENRSTGSRIVSEARPKRSTVNNKRSVPESFSQRRLHDGGYQEPLAHPRRSERQLGSGLLRDRQSIVYRDPNSRVRIRSNAIPSRSGLTLNRSSVRLSNKQPVPQATQILPTTYGRVTQTYGSAGYRPILNKNAYVGLHQPVERQSVNVGRQPTLLQPVTTYSPPAGAPVNPPQRLIGRLGLLSQRSNAGRVEGTTTYRPVSALEGQMLNRRLPYPPVQPSSHSYTINKIMIPHRETSQTVSPTFLPNRAPRPLVHRYRLAAPSTPAYGNTPTINAPHQYTVTQARPEYPLPSLRKSPAQYSHPSSSSSVAATAVNYRPGDIIAAPAHSAQNPNKPYQFYLARTNSQSRPYQLYVGRPSPPVSRQVNGNSVQRPLRSPLVALTRQNPTDYSGQTLISANRHQYRRGVSSSHTRQNLQNIPSSGSNIHHVLPTRTQQTGYSPPGAPDRVVMTSPSLRNAENISPQHVYYDQLPEYVARPVLSNKSSRPNYLMLAPRGNRYRSVQGY